MSVGLRIGVDVDDVLAESLPGYLEAFRRYFGIQVRLEDAAWEIFRRYPEIPEGDMWGFFEELERTDFLATRPVYGEAVEAVRTLATEGHRLVVVTGRLRTHREHTRRLLDREDIGRLFEDLVHRDGEAAAEYKPRVVRERRLDLLIEDELHVALAASAAAPVILFDRPWNRGALPRAVSRVRSWSEALRIVQAMALVRSAGGNVPPSARHGEPPCLGDGGGRGLARGKSTPGA
jgi:uncharacterized HAD superfamily protein